MVFVETVYGFVLPLTLYFHLFLDANIHEGRFSSSMMPFQYDGLELGRCFAFAAKPVTTFLPCYGQFGGDRTRKHTMSQW